jgi:aminomethyltransferase
MTRSALYETLVSGGAEPVTYAGAETFASFGDPAEELNALRTGSAFFDLSFRGMLILTGDDRVRWLNGMVTNNVRDLPLNHGNYSFILNAQGRIQGDLIAYNRGEYVLVTTERSQIPAISEFFDRYIIMDDVEVTDVSDKLTAIGIAGPSAKTTLGAAGLLLPEMQPGEVVDTDWNNIGVSIARGLAPTVDWYEIWFHPDNGTAIWSALKRAGARPIGTTALEWYRLLLGIPMYGRDVTERYLPQETGQLRALHFSKGCYIGQEIVERIRSRATIHRVFTGFEIEGPAPSRGTPVFGPEKQLGEITSAAVIPLSSGPRTFALGYLRVEANTAGNNIRVGESEAKVSNLPFTV